MTDVSATRLYLGNLARNVNKAEIEEHFNSHGTGTIKEVKLMNGFGFIEYEDALDARDVVPLTHGTDLKGERLTVQFARGPRSKDPHNGPERNAPPRPRRTVYRMVITGLPVETSWQDLKDFARQSKSDVVYSEVGRDRDGKGFVEFETEADLNSAVEKLDGKEYKDSVVQCKASIQDAPPDSRPFRNRSPGHSRYEDYGRRGPPQRGFSPRGGYRERSPDRRGGPPAGYYGDEGYRRRSPPPYPPRRDYYEDYPRGPPPPRYPEQYARGPEPYARPPSPRRAGGYGYGGGYGGGYDERRY